MKYYRNWIFTLKITIYRQTIFNFILILKLITINTCKNLKIQVFRVGEELGCGNGQIGKTVFANQLSPDNDILLGIVVQIHANYMLNIALEKIDH